MYFSSQKEADTALTMNKKLKKCVNGYRNWYTSRQMANTNNHQKQTEVIDELNLKFLTSESYLKVMHTVDQLIIERQLQLEL